MIDLEMLDVLFLITFLGLLTIFLGSSFTYYCTNACSWMSELLIIAFNLLSSTLAAAVSFD